MIAIPYAFMAVMGLIIVVMWLHYFKTRNSMPVPRSNELGALGLLTAFYLFAVSLIVYAQLGGPAP